MLYPLFEFCTDMKSLGYVDTGANRISNKRQTDQRQNDDAEWYR